MHSVPEKPVDFLSRGYIDRFHVVRNIKTVHGDHDREQHRLRELEGNQDRMQGLLSCFAVTGSIPYPAGTGCPSARCRETMGRPWSD